MNYFAMTISRAIPLPLIVITGGAWLIGAAATAVAALLTWRRLRWPGLAACAVTTVAVAVLIAGTNWTHFYATTWYATHRSEFAAVTRTISDGQRDSRLAAGASRIDNGHDQPVWFLTAWTGIPDCAAGFAHFAGNPEKYSPNHPVDPYDYLDGQGCAVHPTLDLGEGWWWVE
ncbi:hypothetical protein [Amycolatopsis samaneae]|uniref:DUF4190 domain-containing protein n=1 Tax=Amycolatopsis samaneae TaxID=664691 RepID=A0ABW5GAH0_9PSEU